MNSLTVAAQDALAIGASAVRRLFADPEPTPSTELGRLRSEIINHGSSFAAFRLALRMDPIDLPELLHHAGVYDMTGSRRRRAFDACVDGYAVYEDGRRRGKL